MSLTKKVAENYIKDLKREFMTKTASEISYRTSLKKMIEEVTNDKVFAQIESKEKSDIKLFLRSRASKPHLKQLGTIETKTIEKTISRISKLKELIRNNKAQLQKYLRREQTIMFTNYIEFAILKLNSITEEIEIVKFVRLITITNFKNKNINWDVIEYKNLEKLFKNFINTTILSKPIITQKNLACKLAHDAKELSESVVEQIEKLQRAKRSEIENLRDPVYVFYRQYMHLTRTQNPREIADAFGQTISCGLFLAKLNANSNYLDDRLTQNTAAINIPQAVPVIRELFRNIESYDLPKNLSDLITHIIDTLNQTDIDKVKNESDDVFLYFYEEFLKAFDKKIRARMGVYYTPIEVVDYICEKVNTHLKNEFGRSFGFGDAEIRTLDPATGTGTFLVRAIELAIDENNSSGGGGAQAIVKKTLF